MSPSLNHAKVKPEPLEEPVDEDVEPTDLSMNQNSASRIQSPAQVKENSIDRFQFPQDLSVSPMHLQVNMEARETFTNPVSDSSNSIPQPIPIKVEENS